VTSMKNEANARLLMGIDLGTTRAKVGLYDVQGNQHSLAMPSAPSSVRSAGERSEGDAEAWWKTCCQAIQTCLQEIDASQIAGICVGGQGPSLVSVDADGGIVRPAIMYDDYRAAPEADELSAQLNRPVTVRSSYLPRALWIRNHEPENHAATRWFLQAWDLLVYRLTGAAAATNPLGRYTPWRESDLAAVGLDPERFPRSVRTAEEVAGVSARAASETGLPEGIPVIAGGGDFLLGAMGVAGAQKGIAQSQGGATGAFTLCWDRPLEGEMIGWCIPSPIRPDLLNIGGPLTTGGTALDWLLHSVLRLYGDYETALAGASRIPSGAEGLLFFPYLAGEQLTMCPEARGLFLGLSLQHGPDHLIRAVLEGVAFAGRSIMEALIEAGGRIDKVVTYGGQARSALWNHIKADVWNRPVRVPEPADAGALGAAAIAAVGVGFYPTLAEASEKMGQQGRVYQPHAERAALYARAYAVYRGIYPQTRDLFLRLAAIRENQDQATQTSTKDARS
jgi:xylulokinase